MSQEEQPSSSSKRKAAKDAVIETGKVAASIIGVLGVISAVVGVFFVLFPSLAPWTTYRAELKEAEIAEHNASHLEYAERDRVKALVGRAPKDQAEDYGEIPDFPGNVIRFRIDVEGYQGIPLYVVWSLHDETGTRVPELQDEFGWPTTAVEAENRLDISNAEIHVPLPPTNGTYYVNLELWDKGDEEWFDKWGYSIGGYDEWGNPEEDKSLKCRLPLVANCETASRLASVNTEEFEVNLNANGDPQSAKPKGSDSDSSGAAKTSRAETEAGPTTVAKASSSDPSIAKTDEKAKTAATLKTLPKTGGALDYKLGILGALMVAGGLLVFKALR